MDNSFLISGTIEKIYPQQTGTSQRGQWRKQDFVLRNDDEQYVHRYCFTLFDKRLDDYGSLIVEGAKVQVCFNVTTNVKDDRAYTSLQAINVKP